MMFRKMRGSKGLTLVEMLCATLILIMLILVLNTGMQMAAESYSRMVLRSESDILLSSLSDAVADELRYASNVTPITPVAPAATSENVTYNSLLYGKNTKLSVGDGSSGNKGQIYAVSSSGSFPVLPDGSYGEQPWIYGIPEDGMKITYDEANRLFAVTIKVSEQQPDGTFSGISAEQTFNIRCLNQ